MKSHGGSDDYGGIEGLPLQLMIVILVATMGTAIIVGWMGSIETPHSIGEVEYEDCINAEDGTIPTFTVTVYDQDGNRLEGAVVLLEGMGVTKSGETAYLTTEADGTATFTDLKISPAGSGKVGHLYITVEKSGYSEGVERKVMVIL